MKKASVAIRMNAARTFLDCYFPENTEQYSYNARDELISADTRSYAYDDIGNRTTAEGRAYTANNLNQYTAIDTFTPTYDADGNQTLIQTETGIWTVEYNAENRPVRWTQGDTVITMTFDRMGRRVEMRTTQDGAESIQRFVYNNYLCVQSLTGSLGLLWQEFVWDPTEPIATRPLVFSLPAYELSVYYFHDGNKNVSDLLGNTDATMKAHYEYAPFGALMSSTDSWTFALATVNPFRFSSEYADDTLSLVYYNYRHYNPKDGRFLLREFLGEEVAWHLYVLGKNALLIDVLGLEPFSFDSFQAPAQNDSPYDAYIEYKYTDHNFDIIISVLLLEMFGAECANAEDAQHETMDDSKKGCPCAKCYIYIANAPDAKLTVSVFPNKSWVKRNLKKDPFLLNHEQLHLQIAQMLVDKATLRLGSIWSNSGVYCNEESARSVAKEILVQKLFQVKAATIQQDDILQEQYDQETNHGRNVEEQERWNKKFSR